MSLDYRSLSPEVRGKMLAELQSDIASDRFYISPRLSEEGVKRWPLLLAAAIQTHDDQWLASQLSGESLINATETQTRSGKVHTKKVPYNAPDMLSEGEFNRYYIRGVCLVAIESEEPYVEVYRAKSVANPRSESVALVGRLLDPQQVLSDLQANVVVNFTGPNSGLSVRRCK